MQWWRVGHAKLAIAKRGCRPCRSNPYACPVLRLTNCSHPVIGERAHGAWLILWDLAKGASLRMAHRDVKVVQRRPHAMQPLARRGETTARANDEASRAIARRPNKALATLASSLVSAFRAPMLRGRPRLSVRRT
jgi:hypothetical protein